MSSYIQYKIHIYDKQKDGPYCQARPFMPEYAKHVDEINCSHCLKLVDTTKREIKRDEIAARFNTKD